MSHSISGIDISRDRIAILATHHVPPNTDRTYRCASIDEAREIDVSEFHDASADIWIAGHIWDCLGPVAKNEWPAELLTAIESACRALRVPAPKFPRWGSESDSKPIRKIKRDWQAAMDDARGVIPVALESMLLPIIRLAFENPNPEVHR